MYVEDVKDRSNTPKGCNAMYVEDVEDVKDRSNTPKGCNAMYVEDGKRTYRHTFIIPFLIWYHLNVILCMSKMSKIDQIHLRAVMLCMLKMSKMWKIHQIHLIKYIYLWHLRHVTYPVLCSNYNVDCNSMSSNYSKIRFKPLIYFELQQSSN